MARTGSFTEAARAAALTRPAVSQHIKKLEEHFATQLLVRTTRRVTLTPAGELLLRHADTVLAAVDAMESAMARALEQAAQSLTLGASTLPGECLLPRALASFRRAFPGVEVRVHVGDTDMVVEWVQQGRVDVGLVGRKVEASDLVVEPLILDEIVLVLPPDRPEPPVLSPADLLHLPLILREPGSATRATVLAALERAGISLQELHVAAELGSPQAVKAAVRSGVGAAFVSRFCVQDREFPVARLEGVELLRPVCGCWRRDRPPPPHARALLDQLKGS